MTYLSQLTAVLGYSSLNVDAHALWDHVEYSRHFYGPGIYKTGLNFFMGQLKTSKYCTTP